MMLHKIIGFILMSIALMSLLACTMENNYRGVPEPTWQQLSGEQKQLIVDRSFQDDFQKK